MSRLAWIILILGLVSCSTSPPPNAMTPTEVADDALSALGRYVEMVPLETTDDSLLGGIDKVALDPVTGDILVCDARVTRRLYRFDPDGRFLRTYGSLGQGPGEYENLVTFTVMDNGDIVLLAMKKRLVFTPDGQLITERNSGLNDFYAVSHEDKIFVYSINGWEKRGDMMATLNVELEEIDTFLPYDQRVDNAPFVPLNALTMVGDRLVVSWLCDFILDVYDTSGDLLQRIELPNNNDDVDWDTKPGKPDHRQKVRHITRNLHRAQMIYGVGEMLYIQETHPAEQRRRSLIWDFATQKMYTYPNILLVRAPKDADYLSMSQISGAYEEGLIGVCTDPERFARYQDRYEIAEGIDYGDADNPVLMFFELKPSF